MKIIRSHVSEGLITLSNKTILITAFEPFGNDDVNPSISVENGLQAPDESTTLVKMELPVEFGRAPELAAAKAREIGADAIVCLGLASGRKDLSMELIGINHQNARIADNAGYQPQAKRIMDGEADGLFASVPVYDMAQASLNAGILASVSTTAGTYVCNDLLFELLSQFKNTPVKVGFIHVPAIEGMNKVWMSEADSIRGVQAALGVLFKDEETKQTSHFGAES